MRAKDADRVLREIFSADLEESALIDKKMQEAYEVIRSGQYSEAKRTNRKPELKRSRLPGFVFRCATLLAVVFCGVSVSIYAGSNFYRQRMEAMNEELLDEFYRSTFPGSTIGYSRQMTEEEKKRYKELEYSYENDEKYPEKSLTYLENYEDYTGKGIGLYAARSTLFLPEETLTDEELLQIIDFQHKLVYSIEKINEEIQSGEREDYPQVEDGMLSIDEDAVIAYEGDVDIQCATDGKEYIYLAGTNVIERMKIGDSTSEPFYAADFGEKTVVYDMEEDLEQGLYVLLACHDGENYTSSKLLHIDADGQLISERIFEDIRTADVEVDQEGRLYMQTGGVGDVIVFDTDGTELCRMELPPYKDQKQTLPNGEVIDWANSSSYKAIYRSLCRGEDGKVYLLYEDNPFQAALALIDPEKGELVEVASGFMPATSPHASAIAKGYSSDFIIWRLDGLYTYNLGDSEAEKVMELYEAPFQWEGAECLTLENGQVLFIKAFEQDENGAGKSVPESIRFAYISLD